MDKEKGFWKRFFTVQQKDCCCCTPSENEEKPDNNEDAENVKDESKNEENLSE